MEKVPDFLVNMLDIQYGKDIAQTILKGYESKRYVTLRVNTIKTTKERIKEELGSSGIEFEEVAWNENALVIKNANESEIRKLSMYEEGHIYLQSLSSMLPPIVLNPQEKENILDMAAAPGSKTTQIAQITNNNSMITACEINQIRSERLKYNLEKQGVTCCFVMNKDARNLDDFFSFEKILLDAPCSGSGTITLNNDIPENFTEKLIEKSCKVQTALLDKALRLLKSGGEMVYSTCSILSCENEEIIEKVLKKHNASIIPIEIENGKDIPYLPVKIPGTICVCPNEFFEGFFIAKIKK